MLLSADPEGDLEALNYGSRSDMLRVHPRELKGGKICTVRFERDWPQLPLADLKTRTTEA